MTKTPLFDEFRENIRILEVATLELFAEQSKRKENQEKLPVSESSRNDHERALRDTSLVFIKDFQDFINITVEFEPRLITSAFYRVVRNPKRSFDTRFMPDELTDALLSYTIQYQIDLLLDIIKKEVVKIDLILNFLKCDFPKFTTGWTTIFEEDLDIINNDKISLLETEIFKRGYTVSQKGRQASPKSYWEGTLTDVLIYLKCFTEIIQPLSECRNKLYSIIEVKNNNEVDKQNKYDLLAEEKLTQSEKNKMVEKILAPLSGTNPTKGHITRKEDFERLVSYTKELVLFDKVPDDITQMDQLNISTGHIRYTFYRLHKKVYGTRHIHQSFIDFLHNVFKQFSGTSPTTTKSKFSNPPGSYMKDFDGYIGEGE